MKISLRFHRLMFCLLVMSGGCQTISDKRSAVAREEMSRVNLDQKIERLETLAAEGREHRQRLDERLDHIQRQSSSGNAAVAAEMAAMKQELNRLRSDRETLRAEIVDDITGRVSKMLAEQAARMQSARSAVGPQTGREHVVGQGHTLSEIAAAYGTTVEAIAEANNLSNLNQIRVGQKLFIPE